eukprot:GHVL01017783.1.p1 GENE.GHVL01017783.1~~GHVL01017783.1.p1  ORF type:complete len:816 (-),score=180.06 GHVL01017783.1:2704-5151(-)
MNFPVVQPQEPSPISYKPSASGAWGEKISARPFPPISATPPSTKNSFSMRDNAENKPSWPHQLSASVGSSRPPGKHNSQTPPPLPVMTSSLGSSGQWGITDPGSSSKRSGGSTPRTPPVDQPVTNIPVCGRASPSPTNLQMQMQMPDDPMDHRFSFAPDCQLNRNTENPPSRRSTTLSIGREVGQPHDDVETPGRAPNKAPGWSLDTPAFGGNSPRGSPTREKEVTADEIADDPSLSSSTSSDATSSDGCNSTDVKMVKSAKKGKVKIRPMIPTPASKMKKKGTWNKKDNLGGLDIESEGLDFEDDDPPLKAEDFYEEAHLVVSVEDKAVPQRIIDGVALEDFLAGLEETGEKLQSLWNKNDVLSPRKVELLHRLVAERQAKVELQRRLDATTQLLAKANKSRAETCAIVKRKSNDSQSSGFDLPLATAPATKKDKYQELNQMNTKVSQMDQQLRHIQTVKLRLEEYLLEKIEAAGVAKNFYNFSASEIVHRIGLGLNIESMDDPLSNYQHGGDESHRERSSSTPALSASISSNTGGRVTELKAMHDSNSKNTNQLKELDKLRNEHRQFRRDVEAWLIWISQLSTLQGEQKNQLMRGAPHSLIKILSAAPPRDAHSAPDPPPPSQEKVLLSPGMHIDLSQSSPEQNHDRPTIFSTPGVADKMKVNTPFYTAKKDDMNVCLDVEAVSHQRYCIEEPSIIAPTVPLSASSPPPIESNRSVTPVSRLRQRFEPATARVASSTKESVFEHSKTDRRDRTKDESPEPFGSRFQNENIIKGIERKDSKAKTPIGRTPTGRLPTNILNQFGGTPVSSAKPQK